MNRLERQSPSMLIEIAKLYSYFRPYLTAFSIIYPTLPLRSGSALTGNMSAVCSTAAIRAAMRYRLEMKTIGVISILILGGTGPLTVSAAASSVSSEKTASKQANHKLTPVLQARAVSGLGQLCGVYGEKLSPEDVGRILKKKPETGDDAWKPDSYSIREEDGMMLIPAGNFLLGDEKKPIPLPAFRIDKTEVTVADYARCVKAGNCPKPVSDPDAGNWGHADRDHHPMNNVSWSEANSFCQWAGKRLPTEQEWEKAARGTDGRTYPWGTQEPTCDRAVVAQDGGGCGKQSTWPVCSKPDGDSPYGLCDMAGNVWEWTADWYENKSTRVVRGGSWLSNSSFPRSISAAHRNGANRPSDRNPSLGFRCAQ